MQLRQILWLFFIRFFGPSLLKVEYDCPLSGHLRVTLFNVGRLLYRHPPHHPWLRLTPAWRHGLLDGWTCLPASDFLVIVKIHGRPTTIPCQFHHWGLPVCVLCVSGSSLFICLPHNSLRWFSSQDGRHTQASPQRQTEQDILFGHTLDHMTRQQSVSKKIIILIHRWSRMTCCSVCKRSCTLMFNITYIHIHGRRNHMLRDALFCWEQRGNVGDYIEYL